jgi:hypothetical protein
MSDKPPQPITIDVNQWLAERQNPGGGLQYPTSRAPHPDQIRAPENASAEEREQFRRTQEELRERWQEREEIAEREHLLDNAPRECVECLATRRHYKDDYVCYRCRDAAGGPA